MGYKQGLAKEKRGKTRQGDLSDYMESEHYPQYRERKQEGAGTAWNWAWKSQPTHWGAHTGAKMAPCVLSPRDMAL